MSKFSSDRLGLELAVFTPGSKVLNEAFIVVILLVCDKETRSVICLTRCYN